MSQETVLITGASSGIGRELASLFAADGSQLVLVARREDRLQQLASELESKHGTKSIVIAADLSQPESSERVFSTLQEQGVEVDVLVNNAGFGQLGRFAEIDLQRQLNMIQVNVAALVHLTRKFLPGMIERKRGAILNLGSTASFQPGPNVAVYYATKAFVLSFSEAISEEVSSSGVTVTCLCPGPTITEFGEDSKMHDTPVFQHNAMTVEAVAKAGYKALRRKKRLVIPGVVNNLLATSVRFTPRGVLLKVMTMLQPLK